MKPGLLSYVSGVALVLLPSLAHAQLPPLPPPPAPAPAPIINPALYESGNLRVGLRCAESFQTPAAGLRVTLDGSAQPLPPAQINGENWFGTDAKGRLIGGWIPTDVGYVAPPGAHHLRVETPDCVPEERDVVVSPAYAERVDGRMRVASPMLEGPVGAPDGFGLLLGGYTTPYPESLRSGVRTTLGDSTAFAIDPTSAQGFWLSTSFERRYFALALDTTIGGGHLSGSVRALQSAPAGMPGSPPSAVPFTGSFLDFGLALRVGARLPLRYATLEAGSGIGGDLWATIDANDASTGAPNMTVAEGAQGLSGALYVPLWASTTVKPFCGVGVQGLASYDAEPSNGWHGGVALGVGLLLQPSASCSEPAGVAVRP